MNLYSIASGSSGNCIYVGENNRGVLVDTGVSMKRIREGLCQVNMDLTDIDGIFITHEHSDHISSLGPILRKYAIPVFSTEKTVEKILQSGKMQNVDSDLFQVVRPDCSITVADMKVTPFSISHDAVDPVCYTMERNGKKIAVATDMGTYSDYTISHLKDSEALLLEANHDINMLQVGHYPYSLKLRILSDRGHLSNDCSARLIGKLIHDKLQHVLLGHLSQENNYPQLAYSTVKYELEQQTEWNELGATLVVAKRSQPTCVVTI